MWQMFTLESNIKVNDDILLSSIIYAHFGDFLFIIGRTTANRRRKTCEGDDREKSCDDIHENYVQLLCHG